MGSAPAVPWQKEDFGMKVKYLALLLPLALAALGCDTTSSGVGGMFDGRSSLSGAPAAPAKEKLAVFTAELPANQESGELALSQAE